MKEPEVGSIMFECARCGEQTRYRNEDDLCAQCALKSHVDRINKIVEERKNDK